MREIINFLGFYKRPIVLSLLLGLGVAFWMGDSTAGLTIGLLSNIVFMFAEHFLLVERLGKYIDTHTEIVDSDKEIIDVAKIMRKIRTECSPLAYDIARESLVSLEQSIKDLTANKWIVHSFDSFADVAVRLFADRELKEYCGTSVVRDYEDYWRSAHVDRFVTATEAAIKRKVPVKRLFIFATEEDRHRMRDEMSRQQKMGIEVRSILETAMPPRQRPEDFGIWDGKVAVVLTDSEDRGVNFRGTFFFSVSEVKNPEVKNRVNHFIALFKTAEPFSDFSQQALAAPASSLVETPMADR